MPKSRRVSHQCRARIFPLAQAGQVVGVLEAPVNPTAMVGRSFGRLSVVESAGICERRGGLRWLCRCSCGRTKNVHGKDLRRGDTRSCGCLDTEHRVRHGKNLNRIHGQTKSPSHRVWVGMRQRCFDPKCKDFPNYGGRGIKVCARWEQFENFLTDMGQRPPGHSLDRRDNNGDYSPENCRWASVQMQARNNRGNRLVSIGSEVRCLAEWTEVLGIPRATVRGRMSRGWDAVRALTTPADQRFNHRSP